MRCSCGGTVVITNKPRDGERASCQRCYSCVSIEWLLTVIDEQTEALERAERKIARLYQRGSDTTSALRDQTRTLSNLAALSIAVVQDGDDEIKRLRDRIDHLEGNEK